MDSLGAGGAERSNTDFWMYARERGVEVSIVVFDRRPHGTEREVLEAGFDVTFLRQRHPLLNARELSKIIKRECPDVVHSTLFKSNLRTRLAKLYGASFLHVESLVNTTYDYRRLNDPNVVRYKMEGYRLMDGLTMNPLADELHAITEEVKKHYLRKLGVRPKKVTVIPRGRNPNPYRDDAELRKQYRQEFGVPDGTVLLVSTGRQEFQKGHIYLLGALRYLRDELKVANFRWLLLGREGHATKTINDKVSEFDLHDKVIRAGHRYDVVKILPTADIYVFPSLYEGLGVALLEAQAAGLPIVCSDIPVFHETTSTDNAVYIEPLEEKDFALALRELIAQPERQKEMGEASLLNFNRRFQLDKVHARMLEYFQRLTADH
ncbi:glycosyltransferase family 4 protein [Lewinella sp. IMCC34191]|uniref:glycosyltransferase family 4 protein n=1 Tax=Lewinella sp. IMCC34191 TaxID=2259172 RepID=UPI0018E5767E|nr:glycosyltransferase family 4 protein [Lewinella sp. IMCC34191]